MAYQRDLGEQHPVRETPCVHLRNKNLYVIGELRNPDHPDSHGGHCWCNLTQHIIGPDERQVDLNNCIHGRGCFKETY